MWEDDCVGAASRAEATAVGALADAAGVELLGVRFCDHGVCAATPSPRLDDEDVRAAVLGQVLPGPR